jgi:hypothetical protein
LGEDLRVIERLEIDENQEDCQQEAGIADAVYDKGFRGGFGSRDPLVVVADQEIGAESDALPADKQNSVVVAHHEEQHGNHKQIHIGEESRKSDFTVHVADRIDVNEEADSRHDQQHDACEGINKVGEIDREIAAEDPLVRDDLMGRAGFEDVGEDSDGGEE